MEEKRRFSDKGTGKILLVFLPAVLTAMFTSVATVGSVWLAMHDDILTLKTSMIQILRDHDSFRGEQEKQDSRINELDRKLYRLDKGARNETDERAGRGLAAIPPVVVDSAGRAGSSNARDLRTTSDNPAIRSAEHL